MKSINMYPWQDKNGYSKLMKILTKLQENGYNASMSNNLMFVNVYKPNTEHEYRNQICCAYSSTWHNTGLICIYKGIEEVGSTFDPDKAYDFMTNIINNNNNNLSATRH